MKKATKKGNTSPKRAPPGILKEMQNRFVQQHSGDIVQKPEIKETPAVRCLDLTGEWKTCGHLVSLASSGKSGEFSGIWGIQNLVFTLTGSEITSAKLGTIELLFGGTVSEDLKHIDWGNGQRWVKQV